MHEPVFYAATVWLSALLLVSLVVAVRARSPAARILVLDTVVLILVGLLVLYSDANRVAYFLDAALILAVLGFVSTLAASRFYGEGRLF